MSFRVRDTGGFSDHFDSYMGDREVSAISAFNIGVVGVDEPIFTVDIEVRSVTATTNVVLRIRAKRKHIYRKSGSSFFASLPQGNLVFHVDSKFLAATI